MIGLSNEFNKCSVSQLIRLLREKKERLNQFRFVFVAWAGAAFCSGQWASLQ